MDKARIRTGLGILLGRYSISLGLFALSAFLLGRVRRCDHLRLR